MKPAYYNEIDPYASQVIRELIAVGAIPAGDVDTRSIEDVSPDDLRPYGQCHFFAGFAVWAYALRQCGIPDDRAVWTGSCPCQPFSAAGERAGFADERHLWPAFFHLIEQCRPPVILGEQVASKDADPWVDLVQDDLEALDYAFGAVPFPAAGVGAPHIRDRLYWVADADIERQSRPSWLPSGRAAQAGTPGDGPVGDTNNKGLEGRQLSGERAGECAAWQAGVADSRQSRPTNGFWRDADWLFCRDGKWRPVEPGTFPLAHGAPARVGRLRGYGNAINAEQAKVFIEAAFGL